MDALSEKVTNLEEFLKTKKELKIKLQNEYNIPKRFKLQYTIIKVELQIENYKNLKGNNDDKKNN